MRKSFILASLLALSTLFTSCQSGAIPTTFDGIVSAAGDLGGNLSGFLGGLDLESLGGGALAPLGGYIDTAKGLLGGLDNLPQEAMDKAMSMAGFDSFKGALSGVANFDLDGLMGATGENKAGMLKGLLGESNGLGDAAKALMGALGK